MIASILFVALAATVLDWHFNDSRILKRIFKGRSE